MMANQSILRITREIKQLQNNTTELSLAVTCKDSDVRQVRALVLGPPESPYQFGFYEFAIKFGKEYPASPPSVRALTTNYGRCRFNPNIYASGKVCLSILGTWRGSRGEQWSSAQGLESILISIQSLLSANPYENEPGYEKETVDLNSHKEKMDSYVAKIRHENIRLSVIEPLERILDIGSAAMLKQASQLGDLEIEDEEEEEEEDGPDAFPDIRKTRFLWYYESYTQAIAEGQSEDNRTRKFERMPFESPDNTMDGHFDYPELYIRLNTVRDAIMAETQRWSVEGKTAQEQELGIAANLQRQFEQIVENHKSHHNFAVDLHLVDGNPFVWHMTFFGRPMTHLDGGIFNIKICLSPRFPEQQPRVFVESPLFHYRVANSGVLCYIPERTDEMRYHIEAIAAALEEEPPYDPRTTVNPEATRLFWGTPDDRRKYKRELRRSVERSAEAACA